MTNLNRTEMHAPLMEIYLAEQSATAKKMEQAWGPCIITQTGKYSNARIDGQAFTGRTNWAILEIKSRPTLTYEQLMAYPDQDALFTESKIEGGIEAVSILRAPYVAVLSLPRSKRIFWWAVASGNGDRMLEMRRDRVEVYQPMTGRDEMENVVYLKMSDAHELAERPYWAPHLVARD
jgi:hypothetical protein